MHAIRFHYRPLRYLLTRFLAPRWPGVALGPLGNLRLDEIEPPPLPSGEWVRIEPLLSGICGSDLSALTAHDSLTLEPFGAYPFTLGHENVGRIVEVGKGAGDWKVGERVIVNPMLGCVQRGIAPLCPACARGAYGLCVNWDRGSVGKGPMIGYCPGAGGGWSDAFVAHHSQLHRARQLADEVAVLADPLASALRPVLLHPPGADDIVLVIGSGSIGLLTILALRHTGWEGPLAVLARHVFQQERAQQAGADTVLPSRAALYQWAASLPGARLCRPTLAPRFVEGGPSLIFDTVGNASSMGDALQLGAAGGRVVLVGSAARLRLDLTRLWYRQLRLAGVFVYGMVPWEGRQVDIYQAAIELLARPAFNDLQLVTHTFPLTDYHSALRTALDKRRQPVVKVVFRP